MYAKQYFDTEYSGLTVIVYDGECPLCNAYVKIARLKKHGEIALLDARHIATDDLALIMKEYDLNDGMLLYMDGHINYGHEAINKMALLTTSSNLFNKMNRLVFSNAKTSRILYPFLVRGRLLLLSLLGRTKIGT